MVHVVFIVLHQLQLFFFLINRLLSGFSLSSFVNTLLSLPGVKLGVFRILLHYLSALNLSIFILNTRGGGNESELVVTGRKLSGMAMTAVKWDPAQKGLEYTAAHEKPILFCFVVLCFSYVNMFHGFVCWITQRLFFDDFLSLTSNSLAIPTCAIYICFMITSWNGNIFHVTSLCEGNSTVTGGLMFSLMCARTNGCTNSRDAGDLRCLSAHRDVTIMLPPRGLGLNQLVPKQYQTHHEGKPRATPIIT